MASLNSIYTSNCETKISNIDCARLWAIPNFDSWSRENSGQWLNDSPFCPLQGIQLQLKILGTEFQNNFRVFLVNRDQNPIYLSKCSLQFLRPTPHPTNDGFTYLTEDKPEHELALSDEFTLPWKSSRCPDWNGYDAPMKPWSFHEGTFDSDFEETPGNRIPMKQSNYMCAIIFTITKLMYAKPYFLALIPVI